MRSIHATSSSLTYCPVFNHMTPGPSRGREASLPPSQAAPRQLVARHATRGADSWPSTSASQLCSRGTLSLSALAFLFFTYYTLVSAPARCAVADRASSRSSGTPIQDSDRCPPPREVGSGARRKPARPSPQLPWRLATRGECQHERRGCFPVSGTKASGFLRTAARPSNRQTSQLRHGETPPSLRSSIQPSHRPPSLVGMSRRTLSILAPDDTGA